MLLLDHADLGPVGCALAPGACAASGAPSALTTALAAPAAAASTSAEAAVDAGWQGAIADRGGAGGAGAPLRGRAVLRARGGQSKQIPPHRAIYVQTVR